MDFGGEKKIPLMELRSFENPINLLDLRLDLYLDLILNRGESKRSKRSFNPNQKS